MADKDFNFLDKHPERNVYSEVPPGKTRKTKITEAQFCKTKALAKVCILFEQLIQRLKTFILYVEIPISLLDKINGMLIECATTYNFKAQLYFDLFFKLLKATFSL